ncbi:MAG: histidine--tRNA ligase [Phycisphaerales bacterium]|nr:histidine--tRNA ligase [Phycisphaerales bacterium]
MAKIQAVKGTRDLYPELFRPIRRIFDAWRRASELHGFEEFESPTLEYLDLYREKSGDELVGQLYRLTDAGGRELALRPEMTPSLARMVAAKINALAKPIKWFCIPKLFRGENVQRGRLREFFQWNVDVIGSDSPVADAEVILVGIEALRNLGLTAEHISVHISNRRLIAAILSAAKIDGGEQAGAYALLDKAGKMKSDELATKWNEKFGERLSLDQLREWMEAETIGQLADGVRRKLTMTDELEAATQQTSDVMSALSAFGVGDFCKLDLKIVRGLAYYTGPVFEFFDKSQNERAICGGGRYDDLLGKFGKQQEPAVGFGMGDVVLSLLLEENGLLAEANMSLMVFVADAVEGLRDEVQRVVAGLRRAGVQAEFNYAPQALGKQLKQADKRGATAVVILGDETRERGACQVKLLASGNSTEVTIESLLANPRAAIPFG